LFSRYLGAGEVTPGVLGDARHREVRSDITTGFVALCAIYFPSVTGKPDIRSRFLIFVTNTHLRWLRLRNEEQNTKKTNQIKSNLIVSVACIARLHSSDD